jgi:hypothetical protein
MLRCPRCDSCEKIVLAGKPPHIAQEVCANCGRWYRWLPKTEALARGFGGRLANVACPGGEREKGDVTGDSLR